MKAISHDDPDEAPPPYTPVDPLTPATTNTSAAPSIVQDQPEADEIPAYNTLANPPANFISALPYFQECLPTVIHQAQDETLEHRLTIYSRSQSKDFARLPRCWRPRGGEITQHDWDTFINYLFPPHLGLAAAQTNLPAKLRAEIQRDRKDRPQESDEERLARINAVVTEWNDLFFRPRALRIAFTYVPAAGSAPATPLCPKCYPASVRSIAMRSGPSSTPVTRRPVGTTSRGPSTSQPGTVDRTRGEPGESSSSAQTSSNEQASATRSGPGSSLQSWIAQCQKFGEQAQRAGLRFGEQAQQYGLRLGEQAMAHGKYLEDRAQMYGQMIEQRADQFSGNPQQQAKGFGNDDDPRMGRNPWPGPFSGPFCRTHSAYGGPWGPAHFHRGRGRGFGHGPHRGMWPHHHYPHSHHENRTRSSSVSSTSSGSSVSSSSSSDSVLSMCTGSDLDASDVAAFKAELQNLQHLHDENKGRNRLFGHRDQAAQLKKELLLLNAASKQLRATRQRGGFGQRRRGTSQNQGWGANNNRCGNPRNGNNDSSSNPSLSSAERRAEKKAVKQEVREAKREFRDLVIEIRSERRELRSADRQEKREARRMRREERRQRRQGRREERRAERRARRRGENPSQDSFSSFSALSDMSAHPFFSNQPLPPAPPAPPAPPKEPPMPPVPEPDTIPTPPSAALRTYTAPADPSDSSTSTKALEKERRKREADAAKQEAKAAARAEKEKRKREKWEGKRKGKGKEVDDGEVDWGWAGASRSGLGSDGVAWSGDSKQQSGVISVDNDSEDEKEDNEGKR